MGMYASYCMRVSWFSYHIYSLVPMNSDQASNTQLLINASLIVIWSDFIVKSMRDRNRLLAIVRLTIYA